MRAWLTPQLQAYYNAGYKLLIKFREEGIAQHPDAIGTRDWFQKRLDPEAYELWDKWEFKYENVSDEYYSKLADDKRPAFRERELKRWRVGLWVSVPSFSKLSKQAQADLKGQYPWAGGVQLLPSTHYVLLNYIRVNVKGKGIIKPYYFRRDSLFWDLTDILSYYERPLIGGLDGVDVYEDRDMLVQFKTRGSHYSTSLITQDIKNLLTEYGYSAGLAIDSEEKIQQYIRKVKTHYDTMPKWIKPSTPSGEDLIEYTGSKDNARMAQYFWDSNKNARSTYYNDVLVRSHQPKAWEDLRFDRFSIDEAGLCARYDIIDLIDKAAACMRNERGERIGLITIGGTSDANNERNNPTYHRIKDNPKAYKAFLFFTGVQHIKGHNPETGWTPEEAVIRNVLAEREQIRNIGDLKKLISQTVIDPICINDCLYVKGAVHIDVERCNKHIDDIAKRLNMPLTNPEAIVIKRGFFRPGPNDNIFEPIFQPDPQGGWHIIDLLDNRRNKIFRNLGKKPDPLFFAGADNVDKIISEDEQLKATMGVGTISSQSVVIMDVLKQKPIAYYLYRHKNSKEDHLQTLLACLYYNCYFFPETNRSTNVDFFKAYSRPGIPEGYFYKWLYPTPISYNGNWNQAQSLASVKYGIYTGNTKVKMYETHIVPYMDEHTEKIEFPELLKTITRWNVESKTDKPDLGMAFLITLAGMDDFMERIVPKQISADQKSYIADKFYRAIGRK